MTADRADRAAPARALRPLPAGPPGIVERSTFPQYAYGMLLAARLAVALRVEECSALELGVAGGNGLVEMERLARQLGDEYGVHLRVTGFDLARGMPAPVDYRDCPYIWQEGFFAMDVDALRQRLAAAELVLGDVADTGPAFMDRGPAPVGFVSFDLDFYSSTSKALGALFGHRSTAYLPRVLCYFDDTVGPHEEYHSEFTGELLAIAEFNAAHRDRKLARIHGLEYKLAPLHDAWIAGMYVLHLFDHPRYDDYVYPASTRQFPLEGA